MQTSIPYTYEYQGTSSLNLIETEGEDIIIEVHRNSEGVFEDEYFDVEAFVKGPLEIELEVHEGGYKLSKGEEYRIRSMVRQYLKTKQ